VSYLSMQYPYYLGFGQNASNLSVMHSLPSLGLTMGIGYHVCRVCESRGS
jgi:hypothetical protein